MTTQFKRPDGGTELETVHELSRQETLTEVRNYLRTLAAPRLYSSGRIQMPGQVAAAYAAGDALGIQFPVPVPRGATLQSATYWDLSDLNVAVSVVVSQGKFDTAIGNNDPFDVPNVDELKIDYELQFVVFNDHVTSRSSYIDQIGRDLKFPDGVCWLQAWTPAAQTTLAGRLPRIQLDFRLDP